MKKLVSFVLLVVLCLSLTACGSKNIQIGTSDFYLTLPHGYKMADDNFDEDQVAYYFKDSNSVDFDVYQWDKNGQLKLEEEAAFFAHVYNTAAQPVEINGIKGFKYISVEEFEGVEYVVFNYMFEDETSIVEICFWTYGQEDEESATQIINTLQKE